MTTHDIVATLHELEARLDALQRTALRLADENRGLRRSAKQLAEERASLVARNENARARVEAMISRLKSMESGG